MYIQGSFSLMSPAALLQTLSQEQRTAHIEARRAGSTASVWLSEGLVVAATCDDHEGPEAVYRMVAWPDGIFRVRAAAETAPATMVASAEELLLEAARRRDELAL